MLTLMGIHCDIKLLCGRTLISEENERIHANRDLATEQPFSAGVKDELLSLCFGV